MTGLEIILLLAFAAVAVIAYVALIKWSHYKQWYYTNDNLWEAMLSITEKSIKLWHNLYVKSLNAAQDLDLQVSDLVYESQFKRDYQKEIADCLSIIDDADADIAMLHTNITEMWMEYQALQMERNGAYKELEQVYANHTLTKICHKCKRRMRKDSVLANGVYTCGWCKGKAAKAQSPADLTDAPFEGLDNVKECDAVLFSNGLLEVVRLTDRDRIINNVNYPAAILVNDGYYNICDGVSMDNNKPFRAIRIATALDKKLYQFADGSKKIEKPLPCQHRFGTSDICNTIAIVNITTV